ncbi:MAG TPA: Zn-ribbon domain-containing OB-fold protein [Syntrophales bacterium]|nr:Zn-ribbon domain-containing OB-fold protein [Syntrophales bacterium]HOM07568.1 Zn-ribbon domain-containing OB-fold protein [Syntrophales bacterium]HOO00080.1 Zn-ribbon domain-containing OB-fold protein [Syntrophales bacterium]
MDLKDCFVVEAKMALPNQFFVGRIGSRWIIAMRDQKKIMGLRCEKCGVTYVPPREQCHRCWSWIADNWVEVGTTGELVNYTVVRYNDKHTPKKAPYVLGQIRLAGADTPLTHIVGDVDPADVYPGMKVQAVFADGPVNTLMQIDHFRPL